MGELVNRRELFLRKREVTMRERAKERASRDARQLRGSHRGPPNMPVAFANYEAEQFTFGPMINLASDDPYDHTS